MSYSSKGGNTIRKLYLYLPRTKLNNTVMELFNFITEIPGVTE